MNLHKKNKQSSPQKLQNQRKQQNYYEQWSLKLAKTNQKLDKKIPQNEEIKGEKFITSLWRRLEILRVRKAPNRLTTWRNSSLELSAMIVQLLPFVIITFLPPLSSRSYGEDDVVNWSLLPLLLFLMVVN